MIFLLFLITINPTLVETTTINVTGQFKLIHERDISISELAIPLFVETCTHDLFVNYHLDSEIYDGFLTRYMTITNVSDETECLQERQLFLETDKFIISKFWKFVSVSFKSFKSTTAKATLSTATAMQFRSSTHHLYETNRSFINNCSTIDHQFWNFKLSDLFDQISDYFLLFFGSLFSFIVKSMFLFLLRLYDSFVNVTSKPNVGQTNNQNSQETSTRKNIQEITVIKETSLATEIQERTSMLTETFSEDETSVKTKCFCSKGDCSTCKCARANTKCSTACHGGRANQNCKNCE